MNNLKNKKSISFIALSISIIIFVFVVFIVDSKIRNYKTEVLADYNKLAELENEKNIFDSIITSKCLQDFLSIIT